MRNLCVRAIESGRPAASLNKADLRSPLTNKPVEYRWDGRHMEIRADLGSDLPPVELKVTRDITWR